LSARGAGELRRLLFTGAMSGVKTKTSKPIFERYRERGLPATAALNVIAGKMARAAFSIYRHYTISDATRLIKG
jgi:septin family protein